MRRKNMKDGNENMKRVDEVSNAYIRILVLVHLSMSLKVQH